ncbi:MAG: ferrous iron transport protein B [Candidatus Latescibacterota bacterium]|nr:MAG: ferrous iron transport protein B [Candidatus Latescibacterota bacterium]
MQDPLSISNETTDRPPIILVGNPNVGKSVVFSYLTGRYASVSNFPGTTIEVSRGKLLGDADRTVIDTPGVNSLHPQSLDEVVTRDILLSSFDREILQVADAKNLRRGLTITTQLAEMGLPIVLELNLMDEARRRGIRVSGSALGEHLGIAVVETVAIEKRGLNELSKSIESPAKVPQIRVAYPAAIERGIAEIERILPELTIRKRAAALMFLADPDDAAGAFKSKVGDDESGKIRQVAEAVQSEFSNPLSYIIGVSRSKVVDRLLDTVYLKDATVVPREAARGLRRRSLLFAFGAALLAAALYHFGGRAALSDWGLHPLLIHLIAVHVLIAVVPYNMLARMTTHYILGVVVLLEILYITYLFVGVLGAGTLVDLLESEVFGRYVVPGVTAFLDKLVPIAFVKDLLVGEYGLVSMGITYSIAIVLPIVATFFLAFGVLEDSGYLPRLSVIADRLMRRMGLNGKAVLPMVLGLGCDTMATLTTRILDSKKERIIATLLLALGIPCSAQLGVIMAMAGASSAACVVTVFLVVALQLFIVGALSNKLIQGRTTDFIVELPPIRVPHLGNIVLKTRHRMIWFLKEAVPLFLIGTFVLFILDKVGTLALMERWFRPVTDGLLGLPVESTGAFIIGFFRRDYGAAGLYDLFMDGLLTPNQIAVSMVVITLFVPCIANFFVMIKERGLVTALLMVAFILPFSILVGSLLNLFLTVAGISL